MSVWGGKALAWLPFRCLLRRLHLGRATTTMLPPLRAHRDDGSPLSLARCLRVSVLCQRRIS